MLTDLEVSNYGYHLLTFMKAPLAMGILLFLDVLGHEFTENRFQQLWLLSTIPITLFPCVRKPDTFL